jgi:SET domain-containing protein
VISFDESERRGIIYDERCVSFLFDLNGESVIDGIRFAKDTRFINHAPHDKGGLNCEAKVFLVNGEHRIKFTTLRDITVGEELLFNYGKQFAEKHGLGKKDSLSKKRGFSKNGLTREGSLS